MAQEYSIKHELSGFIRGSLLTGITAGTTQTQAGGIPLVAEHNEISTCANAADAVVMMPAVLGMAQTIVNNGANALQIFPAVGDNLGAGDNNSVSLNPGASVRFRCIDVTNWEKSAYVRESTSHEYQFGVAGAKIGGTAGWVVRAADDLSEATCPASKTGVTLVIPVSGLKVGDAITAFKVSAQIESGGGAVTLDADLRRQLIVAADPTDSSIGAITQVSVTADTAVAASKTGLSQTIVADRWYYVLITVTTAASTDVRFLGVTVTVTKAQP